MSDFDGRAEPARAKSAASLAGEHDCQTKGFLAVLAVNPGERFNALKPMRKQRKSMG